MVPPISLEQASSLRGELARYLKTAALSEIPSDHVSLLRTWEVGEPLESSDGLLIPPWRLDRQTEEGLELTWGVDPGHESGLRRWFVASAKRAPNGWSIVSVRLATAHVRGPR